jgi:hypothetical protein
MAVAGAVATSSASVVGIFSSRVEYRTVVYQRLTKDWTVEVNNGSNAALESTAWFEYVP